MKNGVNPSEIKTQTYVSGTNYLKVAILLSLNYFKLLFQCPINYKVPIT